VQPTLLPSTPIRPDRQGKWLQLRQRRETLQRRERQERSKVWPGPSHSKRLPGGVDIGRQSGHFSSDGLKKGDARLGFNVGARPNIDPDRLSIDNWP
jgi:hypothetical protein